MANRMQRWVEERNRKLQQFTHDELLAEMLRQQIQELEKQEFRAPGNGQLRTDFEKLEDLKLELAAIQEHADIRSQGRLHSNKIMDMMAELRDSSSMPPHAEKTLKDYLSWLEVMEDHRRKDYTDQRNHIVQNWPVASWEYRGRLLRWFGKEMYHRVARQKIPYYISRVAMGQLLKWVRR